MKLTSDNILHSLSTLTGKLTATLAASFKALNPFEICLMSAIMLLAVLSFVIKGEFAADNCVAAVSAVLGVFCVVFGAKGSMANWIFGVVECLLYSYICIKGHIYGDAIQRVLYTLPMQFVGWYLWSKRKRDDNTTQIHTRYMSWHTRLLYLAVMAAMVGAFGAFLKFAGPHLTTFFYSLNLHVQPNYTNQLQLWMDATTTILFIVTMWMSVKAYVEQWYLWLFINALSICIWAMSATDFSFMTVSKYSVYLINSIYGIYMWNKLSKN